MSINLAQIEYEGRIIALCDALRIKSFQLVKEAEKFTNVKYEVTVAALNTAQQILNECTVLYSRICCLKNEKTT